MMKLIGAKRVFLLAVLLGFNIVLTSVYFFYLNPILEETRMQMSVIDEEIADLSSKLSNSQQEKAYMEENMPKYQKLREGGFFQHQDRFMMSRWLEDMRNKAELATFNFTIDDMETVPSLDAAAMEHKLVSSRIHAIMNGIAFDTALYSFIQDVPKAFPLYTRLRSFRVKRAVDVNRQTLDSFGKGGIAGFIEGEVSFEWLTLVPEATPAPAADPNQAPPAPEAFRGR